MTGTILPGASAGFQQGAGIYDATGTEFFTRLGEMLVEEAGIQPGARVLDLGCGPGAATLPAARAAGAEGHVTALDGAPAMLTRNEAAARRAGLSQISWLLADAGEPPLPPGTQNVILASFLVQFLGDPQGAARNWLPLLAPGGTLAVSWGVAQDPAWAPVMAVFDDAVPAPDDRFEQHMRRPPFDSPGSMDQFLVSCGYTGVTTTVVEVTSRYTGPGQWWDATRGQAPYLVYWRHIPEDALDGAKAEAFALLENMRGSDGLIRRTLRFGLTAARSPAG